MVVLTLGLFVFSQERPVVAETLAPNNDDEIVYFDGYNVIRVYDPSPSSTVLEVQWSSPDGGWGAMALGDVTGDGDMEIVDIRAEGNGGRLTVFDPVAQDSPLDQVQTIDGVPWATLYELSLPRAPRLVAVGEFDVTRVGREILYSFAEDTDDGEYDRFVILHSSGNGLPGRGWEEQTSWRLEGRWSAVATGNMYLDDAIDEVGLVSNASGELGIFRVEPNVVRTFTNVNVELRWTGVAFGQFIEVDNDGDEIAAVRDADLPLASAWVFRNNGTAVVDQFSERLSPSPNVVFFANIGGNGDDELVVLRQVRPELGARARLIVRDGNNNESISMREDLLDGDNEYKGGDGGDIDADGRDEIVVIRNNRIRIYPEPEKSATVTLVERFTNGTTVKLGNLDAAGLSQTPVLFASVTSITAEMVPGQTSGGATVINLLDSAKGTSMPFTVNVVDAADWVNFSQSASQTPATLSVTFDATNLQPGEYSGQIVVDVQSSGVQNDPLTIELALTVEAVVTASPPLVDFLYFPCEDSLPPRSQSVALSADEPYSYTAQIEGNPTWVTVAPEAGVLPEAVTVSVDPALRPANSVSADLLVTVDLPNRPGVVNRVPISINCASNRTHIPSISK